MHKVISAGITCFTYLIALVFFFPIFWIFLTGFKTENEAIKIPPTFKFNPTLENFQVVWNAGMGEFFMNSMIVAVCSTLIALVLGVPAAYALAMFKIKRKDDILFWVISTRFLPVAGIIIPLYLVFKSEHLLDSLIALILLYAAMNVSLIIWMMRSFFNDVSYEIIEATQIDGASGLQSFFQVVLPLVKPGLVSTALLSMVFAWNEFFFAVSLSYTKAATLPVYMSSYMTQEGLFWAKMSAAATISIIPVIILGWFTQKQLVRGLTMGAVKG